MLRTLCSVALSATLCVTAAHGADQAADNAALKAEVEDLLAKSQAWLAAQYQADGSYLAGGKFSLGITALALDALQSAPAFYAKDAPEVTRALEYLWQHQQESGGIYVPDEGLGNYNTSLTLMAMDSCGRLDPERTKRMQNYLFGLQNNDADSITYGGIGYGSRGKGNEDLSNTGMAIEALSRSGVPADDPHMQKALAFLERCQDLSSVNKLPWAGNSGGAVYSPDESKAGGSWRPAESTEVPKLAPYGGMTYQLISSYVALDVRPGDPRLDAAFNWVKQNYRFDGNPGMAAGNDQQGLFYYYMVMAKSFDLLDATEVETKDGKRDWRRDLFNAIKERAAPAKLEDGRDVVIWINSTDRWAEGMPNLTAGYLIKALKRIHQSLD